MAAVRLLRAAMRKSLSLKVLSVMNRFAPKYKKITFPEIVRNKRKPFSRSGFSFLRGILEELL